MTSLPDKCEIFKNKVKISTFSKISKIVYSTFKTDSDFDSFKIIIFNNDNDVIGLSDILSVFLFVVRVSRTNILSLF